MSLSSSISTTVSANETTQNGTEIGNWKERCYAYVQEDVGLDICHQGINRNETRINEFIKSIQDQGCPEFQSFESCTQYSFPTWLDPVVKFLWFLFACQVIICCMWMYYFWTNVNYRKSIFRLKDDRHQIPKTKSQDSLVGDSNRDTVNSAANSNVSPLVNPFLPQGFQDTDRYKLRKFLFQDKIEPDDVIFGHKIFHFPTFRLEGLRKIDQKIPPRARISLSFLIIFSSLIALVGDFFIDVYFLHGLSTDTLIDVKNIHFEKAALIAMVFFEFTGKDPHASAPPITVHFRLLAATTTHFYRPAENDDRDPFQSIFLSANNCFCILQNELESKPSNKSYWRSHNYITSIFDGRWSRIDAPILFC